VKNGSCDLFGLRHALQCVQVLDEREAGDNGDFVGKYIHRVRLRPIPAGVCALSNVGWYASAHRAEECLSAGAREIIRWPPRIILDKTAC